MIRKAQIEASRSRCRNQHGAVVGSGKRVFGCGCNSYKTHAKFGGGPLSTLHAEAAAIRDAKRSRGSVKGADIYIARIDSRSKLSKPCTSCAALIKKEGIRRVFYTSSDGTTVCEHTFQLT